MPEFWAWVGTSGARLSVTLSREKKGWAELAVSDEKGKQNCTGKISKSWGI